MPIYEPASKRARTETLSIAEDHEWSQSIPASGCPKLFTIPVIPVILVPNIGNGTSMISVDPDMKNIGGQSEAQQTNGELVIEVPVLDGHGWTPPGYKTYLLRKRERKRPALARKAGVVDVLVQEGTATTILALSNSARVADKIPETRSTKVLNFPAKFDKDLFPDGLWHHLRDWEHDNIRRSSGQVASPDRNCDSQCAAEHPGRTGERRPDMLKCKLCDCVEDATALLCDSCGKAVHMRCLLPKPKRVPHEDQWLCQDCSVMIAARGDGIVGESVDDRGWLSAGKRSASGAFPEGAFSEGPTIGLDRNWLLKPKHAVRRRVRTGTKYQAAVPSWTGVVNELDDKGRPDFGSEVAISSDQMAYEKFIVDMAIANNQWPMGWAPASSVAEDEPQKWLQCTAQFNSEEERRVDGRAGGKKEAPECGKWRRVPLDEEADEDGDWECSCALKFDPKHADCAVPQELPRKDIDRRLKLAAARAAELQRCQPGMRAARAEEKWEAWLNKLGLWKEKTGHCHVPLHEPLGQWLQGQRIEAHHRLLPVAKIASLEAMGVVLDDEEARWEESFQSVANFMSDHGHCDVAKVGGKQGAKLALWCKEQRQVARHPMKTPLQLQQIVRLMEMGFSFAEDEGCGKN